MEDNSLQPQKNKNLNLQTNQSVEFCKTVYHVNQLSPFKVPDEEIKEWVKSIEEIVPNLEIDDLKHLIRCFKTGEEWYDSKIGIQNIFTGLKNRFGDKYIKTSVVR